jgi:dephospho-CoA kinase
MLGARGAVVIDADEVARAVSAPGQPAHDEILAAFGDVVRAPDGSLDRAALARLVFADPDALRQLERIIHPRVRPAILARIDAAATDGAPAVVIEAIKLVEGGLAELCDEVWLITCDVASQTARLAARGDGDAEAAARVAAQGDIVGRLRDAASSILDTSADAETTRRTVVDRFEQALSRRA